MKKLSILGILLCLIAGTAGAAVLSGKVQSVATCSGVAGQKVYVHDSLNLYIDSTITNSNGEYSFTIPSSTTFPQGLDVSTVACSTPIGARVMYKGRDVKHNIIVCGTGKYLGINLFRKPVLMTPLVGPVVIYLIRRDVNPTTFDTTLTAVDSTYDFIQDIASMFLPCQPAGTYLMKAALLPGHPDYASYLPTYSDSALNWSGAKSLTATQFAGQAAVSIHMIAGTNPGGPGFIGGSVLVGANKSTAVGDPLSKRILILTDAAGKAVAFTYSDASGQFQFPSLPYGTYKLFGDAGGKTNPPLMVTLSASAKTVNNIIFEENDKTFKGHFNTVSVGGMSTLPGVSVFPNPVKDFVHVNGLAAINGNKTVALTNVTGSIISSQIITQGDATISTVSLPAGIYLLQVQTEAGPASFRIVK